MQVDELELTLSPEEAVAAWPRLEPLAVLWSGGPSWRVRNPRSRWTVLARPRETRTVWAGPGAGAELAGLLDEIDPGEQHAAGGGAGSGAVGSELPFAGGWLGLVSYEAGGVIEPAVRMRERKDAGRWPLAAWQRCDGAYVYDRWTGRWWVAGDREALPELEGRRAPVEQGAYMLGSLRSDTGRAAYEKLAARTVEYIRAGDIFQANIAHRLSAPFEGSARAAFMDLCRRAQPWHGAYLELDLGEGGRGALVSVSPELFLEYDGVTRRVMTRPMKGTRPMRAGGVQGGSEGELARSEKDAAELHMIVDLMRNDLGRVCRYGSVRVDEGRVIESHGEVDVAGAPGVLQGVATVSGEVRAGVGLREVLWATFPPGSVTGAPKVRAIQVIDELEVSARGPYCGAVGYISDHGRVGLNVAIRTACIRGKVGGIAADEIGDGELSYSVGAGIVADSAPSEEWRETLVKAGVITGLSALKE